jgi:NTP pyrophosphatase (non-canonical NTP hydrolase)
MDIKDYQNLANGTDLINDLEGLDPKWVYYVLGLTEEAGELAGKVKRIFRDDGGMLMAAKHDELVLEAGDVMWYLTRLMNYLGIDMQTVLEANINKLYKRREKGTLHGSGDDR